VGLAGATAPLTIGFADTTGFGEKLPGPSLSLTELATVGLDFSDTALGFFSPFDHCKLALPFDDSPEFKGGFNGVIPADLVGELPMTDAGLVLALPVARPPPVLVAADVPIEALVTEAGAGLIRPLSGIDSPTDGALATTAAVAFEAKEFVANAAFALASSFPLITIGLAEVGVVL
jgi:hypothetical protein